MQHMRGCLLEPFGMTGVFGPERSQSPRRLHDLDVMVLQQIPGRVV